jgi:hypothetical protein
MKGDIGRFLACTVVSAACFAGCTVETTTSGVGTNTGSTSSSSSSGPGSTSSSTTGAGGAGTGGSTGTGGAPSDAGGDVSLDGGGTCFPDDTSDAGSAPACDTLGYSKVNCGDDAMAEPPFGAFTCQDLEGDLKIAAMQELFDCLKTIPGADGGADDACSMAHEMAASACSVKLFSRTTCSVPNSTVDGGALGCAQIVASCPASADGAPGITMADCQRFLSPFNDAARQFIISCYFDPMTPQGTGCADKFENKCVFPE